MDQGTAEGIIEAFRKGIPPAGYVQYFTVGRDTEISELKRRLVERSTGTLLVQATYGLGKTHLLHLVREYALEARYVVSLVTLESASAVGLHRMDQLLGAVWRGMEIPEANGEKGLSPLFNKVMEHVELARRHNGDNSPFWKALSHNWQWDYSETLRSPSLFLATRAWLVGQQNVQALVEDWLYHPWLYRTRREYLYRALVANLRKFFRDPRPEWHFADPSSGIFDFQSQDFAQSWSLIADLHLLARECGYSGLVILFDEFEDVIENLHSVRQQEVAFWHLFQFYSGIRFPGMSFFAVTPDFVKRCQALLMAHGHWDYDYTQFETLPVFTMTPLSADQLEILAKRIADTYLVAYGPTSNAAGILQVMTACMRKTLAGSTGNDIRNIVRAMVKELDLAFED